MTFTWPTWFWAMSLVAAAAVWAMFRPSRKHVDVASVSLWQEALAATPPAGRRARRISWSWLLLLAGATAGVIALAGPVVRPEAAARHVSIALRPSAELGGPAGLGELRHAVGALLDRLNADDRVQWLLPAAAGGSGQWVSPAKAREELQRLAVLWAPADQLDLPHASSDAQHTWIFSPAGATDAAGPNVTVVLLPAHLPPVTIDAMAAEPDGRAGARLFVAFRNQTDRPQSASARADDGSSSPAAGVPLPPLLLPPGGRGSVSASVAGAETIRVSIGSGSGAGEEARLVRRESPRAKVATIGPDEPLLRKFIAVCPGLELTGTPGEADLIFANAPAPKEVPAGKPALLVDPQGAAGAMTGWTRTDASVTVVSPAVTNGQDPVMRDVSLAGLALRRVRPWVRQGDAATGVELVRCQKGALILRSDPVAAGAAGEPRRVYLAFDLSAENARFDRPEMLPILLANATEWLLGDRPLTAGYETPAPTANLTGLQARPVTASPLELVARTPLPEPLPSRPDVPLWPVLALTALTLWLGGWAARSA